MDKKQYADTARTTTNTHLRHNLAHTIMFEVQMLNQVFKKNRTKQNKKLQ